jgi:hypothetical protein
MRQKGPTAGPIAEPTGARPSTARQAAPPPREARASALARPGAMV